MKNEKLPGRLKIAALFLIVTAAFSMTGCLSVLAHVLTGGSSSSSSYYDDDDDDDYGSPPSRTDRGGSSGGSSGPSRNM